MRKVKIGYVPCFHPNARGDSELNEKVIKELKALAAEKDFELCIASSIVYGYDTAKPVAAEMNDLKLDFLFLTSFGATIGNFVIPFEDANCPVGVWGMPETTMTGLLPLNAFCGTMIISGMMDKYYTDRSVPFKWFYGSTDDPLFIDRFEITLKALRAMVALKETRIAAIGPVVNGFDYMMVRESDVENIYGAHIDRQHTIGEIISRARSYDKAEADAEISRILEEGKPDASMDSDSMDKFARLSMAFRDFAGDYDFNVLSISCWTTLQDVYDMVPCGAISRLNNSGLISACEGDIDGAIGMIIDKAFNDGAPASMADLVSLDMEDSSLNIWHCGPMPGCMADKNGITWDRHFNMGRYEGTNWCGCGVVADLTIKPGIITMNRVCTPKKEVICFSGEVFEKEGYQGSSGWVRNFRMGGKEMSIRELMTILYNYRVDHHMSFGYGDNEDAFREFAAWKGLKVAENTGYVPYLEHRA